MDSFYCYYLDTKIAPLLQTHKLLSKLASDTSRDIRPAVISPSSASSSPPPLPQLLKIQESYVPSKEETRGQYYKSV